MNAAFGRRLFAEFVGTALLVIFGAGALVAALGWDTASSTTQDSGSSRSRSPW